MFIFLYGPDDYRRAQKKREIIVEFKKKHAAIGLGTFDLEAENGVEDFLEFTRSQSIFENVKLAVLENTFEAMETASLAKLLKPLTSLKNVTILIAEKDKPVKALAFLIEKPSLAQKFENLEGTEWLTFIKTEAKRNGFALAESAARFLGTVYQGNTWALITELQKLGAMKAGGVSKATATPTITEKDLDALDLEAAPNYWALLNGMKSYDMSNRLMALETLFAINDPAAKIFNILAAQAGQNTPRMAEYDLAVKSGKLDYEEVLLDLILT